MRLPNSVIKQDHRLEGEASSATQALAELRWHWTLDQSNPERVAIRAYARAVGRHHKTVSCQARGYADWLAAGGGAAASLNEYIERAKMGVEQESVTEAVAAARGIGIGHVRSTRAPEIRRVREIARERAEKRGTSVEEEATKVADWIVKSEKAELANKTEKAQRRTLRFVAVEAHLLKAMRALTDALNESHHVDWGEEERDLLRETLQKVKDLLGLVDTSLVGVADIDWDAELARIADGAA